MHLPKATRRRIVYATAAAVVCTSTVMTWKHFASTPVTSVEQTTPVVAVSLHPELEVSTSKDAPQAAAPAAGGQAVQPETKEQEPQAKVTIYTVEPGDTIGAIAERLGLKSDSILSTNNLSEDDLLQVGQELLIPSVDGVVVEVESGDTIWDLAQDYGVTDVDIVNANPDIDPDNLKLGQVLLIPGGQRQSRQLASRSLPGRPSGRKLAWPAYAELTDDFGSRIHPVFGTPHYHDGIDIGVGSGTPVGAAAGGTVIMATWYGGYGRTIRIEHGNGLVTMYSHLNEYAVSVGEKVSQGDLIGYSGNSGNSTGAHLHFTILVDGSPVDPLGWLP
ncbi:MAG TPA: peptidoglycan DD-metalloendopeptidase family protein [Symbiobacteriaceae bacterium]|nr:peptidoglycan DD-metalloendopeptidase family protein [Symbiobacteriaceae bacterium]